MLFVLNSGSSPTFITWNISIKLFLAGHVMVHACSPSCFGGGLWFSASLHKVGGRPYLKNKLKAKRLGIAGVKPRVQSPVMPHPSKNAFCHQLGLLGFLKPCFFGITMNAFNGSF
jgi:hypothetical protein